MVSTKTSPRAGQSKNLLIIAMVRGFPHLQIAQTCSVAHPASNWMGTRVLSWH